jgi:DNA-binding transcriptional regulator YdaS (Cro superfamily)
VSAATVKLLRAASEIVGGEDALAERLGIGKTLFSKFMSGSQGLPDVLLLRAVDIILAERHSGSHGNPT